MHYSCGVHCRGKGTEHEAEVDETFEEREQTRTAVSTTLEETARLARLANARV